MMPGEFDSARDNDGHGTHTASTAAGNAGVAATIFGQPRGTISGIAPRAYVAAYKGWATRAASARDLVAAIDQAVADGVDVINYSIGSLTAPDPYRAGRRAGVSGCLPRRRVCGRFGRQQRPGCRHNRRAGQRALGHQRGRQHH